MCFSCIFDMFGMFSIVCMFCIFFSFGICLVFLILFWWAQGIVRLRRLVEVNVAVTLGLVCRLGLGNCSEGFPLMRLPASLLKEVSYEMLVLQT